MSHQGSKVSQVNMTGGEGPAMGGWSALAWMTIVLLMAFAFGARGLNTEPIWADELFSLSNMGVFDGPYSPGQIVDSITTYSADHVPLYYFLGAGWAHFVGWTQASMRMFSVLAGALMVAWLYRFVGEMFGRRAGLVAGLLMSTSAYALLFFHDIRMYTMLLLLFCAHGWLYWRIAYSRTDSRLGWLFLFLSGLALLYTHVFSLLVFALLGMHHLLFAPRSGAWPRMLLVWAVAGLFFAPYLPTLGKAIAMAAENEKVAGAAASIPELTCSFFLLLVNGVAALIPLFAVMVAYALRRTRSRVAWQWLAVSVGTLVLIMVLNEALGIIPVKRMRYFLILWPPFIALCAFAVTSMPRWKRATALWCFVWMVSGHQFYLSQELQGYSGGMQKAIHHPPMHEYARALQGKVREEDYLLGFSFVDYVNHVYKFGDSVIDYYTGALLGIDGAFIPYRWHEERLLADMERKIDGHPYLLLAYHPDAIRQNHEEVVGYLEARYDDCGLLIDGGSLAVRRYKHVLAGCGPGYRPIHYDNGVKIVDRFGAYDAEEGLVRAVVGWEVAGESQLERYSVSLQVLDSEQRKYAQGDWYLYDNVLKWHEVELRPTEEMPAGYYRVAVVLYDRESGEKVQGVDLNSGERAHILPLLTFSVEL